MSLTTLHEVGLALGTYLAAQACPLPVIDGPEGPKTVAGIRERIVIEHDDGKASFGAPHGLHSNAKHSYTATDSIKITIYARNARAGALMSEHRARALLVREQVLSGLRYVAASVSKRPQAFTPKSGAFTSPADMADSEKPNGAVYEITAAYELPIRVVTFAGEAVTEGTLTGMTSRTAVSLTGAEDDDDNPNTPPLTSETACGA